MRVDFYHLQRQTLEDVLPKLLEKAYSTDKKIKVKVGNESRLDFLNSLLWTLSNMSSIEDTPIFIPASHSRKSFMVSCSII